MMAPSKKEKQLLEYITLLLMREGAKHVWAMPLIKYVYLADYYSFMFEKRSLTGWDWKMWHYGPWTNTAILTIQLCVQEKFLISETQNPTFDEGREYETFHVHAIDRQEIEERVEKIGRELIPNIRVRMALESEVKRYGLHSKKLLNHVYVDTLPVSSASKGQTLSFAEVVEPPSLKRPEPIKYSAKQKQTVADIFARATKEQQAVEFKPPAAEYDDEFFSALKIMEQSELEDLPESAVFNARPDANEA